MDNVTVRYGNFVALNSVSLEFKGGALGLLGPNGAGKSTLLRALLGFVQPSSGSIYLLGEPSGSNPRALRRRIGYHPEDDVQLPDLNAVAAVSLCGQLAGLPRDDALQRAHEILYFVGLGEVRYRLASTYSQGMRQRLKLAQALVHDPEFLILDEPTNGLDPKGRQSMLALIKDLSKVKNINLVLCSHLLPDVEAVCDQVVVLKEGKIRRSGTTDELLQIRNAFDLRIHGDPEGFMKYLEDRGTRVSVLDHGIMRVEIEHMRGRAILFEAALHSESQIRLLTRARQTLTDVFAESVIGSVEHADS